LKRPNRTKFDWNVSEVQFEPGVVSACLAAAFTAGTGILKADQVYALVAVA